MNLREVEVFQAVMTCGTASRAAELLSISQPAVSKAIQSLETKIGFNVFDRVKGRLVPTAEGQLLFREVEAAFIGLTRLRNAAARINDFGSGDLRVACLTAFSSNLLPLALYRFHQANPKVAITFQVRSSSVIRDLVASDQFDIGIAADEVDTTGLIAVPYLDVRAALALPHGHHLAEAASVTPTDLHEVPFVALAPEDTTRREADALFAAMGVRPQIVAETPYSATVCALVLAGLGCGIVDPITAPGFLERGLILKPLDPPVHFRTLILYPPNQRRSRLVQQFTEELLREKARYRSIESEIFG